MGTSGLVCEEALNVAKLKKASRVMLYGGEDETLELLEEIISSAGFVVQVYRDKTTLNSALMRMPDLIICDEAGDTNGEEFYDRLSQIPGRKNKWSYMLLSDELDGERVARCLNKGIDEFIVKPFDVDEFLARVSKVIRTRGMNEMMMKSLTGEHIGLRGHLDFVELTDLLMVFHRTVPIGALHVKSPEGEFSIYFLNGDIVGVEGPDGLSGLKAFERAIRTCDGAFRFSTDKSPYADEPLFPSIPMAILNAVQVADEYRMERGSVSHEALRLGVDLRISDVSEDDLALLAPFDQTVIESISVDVLIHASEVSDLTALRAILRLLETGVLLAN
jgi:CheY-like chemotaxis protein